MKMLVKLIVWILIGGLTSVRAKKATIPIGEMCVDALSGLIT